MSTLQLMYSRSNQAFVFVKDGRPFSLQGERMHFRNKADALKAAERNSLLVDAQGNVRQIRRDGARDLEGVRKYNQKGYSHYVVVWPSDMPEPRGTVSGSERPGARIDSGWEFREDAKDRYTEVSESEDMKAKIVAKVSLKSWGLDPDSNGDWITSAGFSGLEGGVSPKTRVGTRVRFQPTAASLPLYSSPPAAGEEGVVTTVSFGGGVKKSFLPGPGGGLLYVKWDRTGVQGVSPIDVVKASGRSGVRVGPGRPGMKFERDDVEITTTLHPMEFEGLSKSDKLKNLDRFTLQYINTALWSSNDQSDDSGGEPLDSNYGPSDLTNDALDKMIKDCRNFQEENAELLARAGDASQNGHDFWLTRNGHGAGFWDRDYDEDVGKGLTDAAHAYGTVNLDVSNGKIHHD